MKSLFALCIGFLLMIGCQAQPKHNNSEASHLVGGSCEGCEAVFEYGNKTLTSVDTLPDFHDKGSKLKLTGVIYQPDGKTPAKDVILYIYHTNQKGIYPAKGGESGWARRHGYIRGWIKTDNDGNYEFYTLKPGAYPGGGNPAHIHTTILEPDGKYYWIDEYHFAGDPYLTEQMKPKSPRGGTSGVLELKREGNLLVGKRDLILGKNVPNYK